jgi:molybdate transport system substrate-binding protein
MKRLLLVIVFLLIGALNLSAQNVTVAAAADLRYALDEVISRYKLQNPNVKIDVIYGASGNLYQQITNKAPFDIFFSADNSYPLKLSESGLISGTPKLYAIGHLVLWSANKDITKGIYSLKSRNIKKISIANPEVAPYGKRAVECLKYYKLDELLKDKIVKADNVSQAAQFVLTGNADAGLIALSLAMSKEMKGKGRYIQMDEKSYTKLEQSYVLLKAGDKNTNAVNFIKFIDSKTAKDIFSKYGFKLPKSK